MTQCQDIQEKIVLTTDIGQKAESAAAEYLSSLRYEILDRNWKLHKICEIDIVARKDSTVYFVEVKYRRSNTAGAGLEYITSEKLKKMRFAAMQWATIHAWQNGYELSAVEVSGTNYIITNFIETI
jgi:Holliday junction resolvase-like predicted endonuclease